MGIITVESQMRMLLLWGTHKRGILIFWVTQRGIITLLRHEGGNYHFVGAQGRALLVWAQKGNNTL